MILGCGLAAAAYAAFLALLLWAGRRLRLWRDTHGAPH